MPDYYQVSKYTKTKGHAKVDAKYKPAKGNTSKGSFDNRGRTKPATRKAVPMVDKKVKKISNKVMKLKSNKNPGPAAQSTYGGNYA